MNTSTELYEICVDCPMCEGIMVVKISGDRQVADIFKPCPACRVLSALPKAA